MQVSSSVMLSYLPAEFSEVMGNRQFVMQSKEPGSHSAMRMALIIAHVPIFALALLFNYLSTPAFPLSKYPGISTVCESLLLLSHAHARTRTHTPTHTHMHVFHLGLFRL